MRPELSDRVCGQCGKVCLGYDEFAPMHDPPRRCAACAIDARFWARWIPRTLAILSGLAFAGLLYITAYIAIALTSLAWQRNETLMILGWLVLSLVGFGDLLTLWSGWKFLVRASHEGERVREILEQDRRLERMGVRERDPVPAPTSVPDPSDLPDGPAWLKRVATLMGLLLAASSLGTAVAAVLAMSPPWGFGERFVVARNATLLLVTVMILSGLAWVLLKRTLGPGPRYDGGRDPEGRSAADLERILAPPESDSVR